MQQIESNNINHVINSCIASLVMFSRESCHVCEEVMEKLKYIEGKYENKVVFYYVDVEADKSVLKTYFLKGVPQLLFFRNGELYSKVSGNVEEDVIEEHLDELAGSENE